MVIPEILYSLGFGVRSLTFEDFETACAEMKFPYFLTDEKLIDEGISFPRTRHGQKHHIIILKNTLFRLTLAEVAWHEFGHAYFSHYGVRCFVRGSEDKAEKQVDDLALCCLIPTLWIRTRTREEILSEGFTIDQIYRRINIFETCGV
jgi:hypothetical protein